MPKVADERRELLAPVTGNAVVNPPTLGKNDVANTNPLPAVVNCVARSPEIFVEKRDGEGDSNRAEEAAKEATSWRVMMERVVEAPMRFSVLNEVDKRRLVRRTHRVLFVSRRADGEDK